MTLVMCRPVFRIFTAMFYFMFLPMESFIRNIIFNIKRAYDRSSNDKFCKYLKKRGVKVGKNVKFRYPLNTTIDLTRPELVEFGNNLDINDNFTIMTHDFGSFVFLNLYHDFVPSSGKVQIGNNVYIGRDVTVLKGAKIGNNCIIGLGSVVTKDIPDNSVACGCPCKVICTIEEYYKTRKIKSVEEAKLYYKEIKQRRSPVITDFIEEWSLFFRESDFNDYPQMINIIKSRLKGNYNSYFSSHQNVFNGWEDFVRKCEED